MVAMIRRGFPYSNFLLHDCCGLKNQQNRPNFWFIFILVLNVAVGFSMIWSQVMRISSQQLQTDYFRQSGPAYQPVLVLLFLIVFFVFSAAFSGGATANDAASAVAAENEVASSGLYQVDSDPEQAKKRQLMEQAIHEQKIKRNTKSIDEDNARRAAGEILSMDIFLATFLSAFWMMVSFLINSRFFTPAPVSSGTQQRAGSKVFYGLAALIPVFFLWVAVINGYASRWIAFSISLVIYLGSIWVLKQVKNAKASTPS